MAASSPGGRNEVPRLITLKSTLCLDRVLMYSHTPALIWQFCLLLANIHMQLFVVTYSEICPAVPTLIMPPSVRWALQAFSSSAAVLPNGTCVWRTATSRDPGMTKSWQVSIEKLVGWGLGDLGFFWNSE